MTEAWHKYVFTTEVYSLPEEKPVENTRSPEAKEETPVTEEPVILEKQPSPSISFTGTNERNVLILVPSQPADSDLELLGKILKAVGCELNETAMVIYSNQSADDMLSELAPTRVLSFGLKQDPWVSGAPYELVSSTFARHIRPMLYQFLERTPH